jgi:hypothetical protein
LAIHRGLPTENPSTTALRPLSLERGADAAKLIEAVRLQFHEPSMKGTIVATTLGEQGKACLICMKISLAFVTQQLTQ